MFWKRRASIAWQRPTDREVERLQHEVEELRAELDAERRRSAVKDAEIETLAGVVIRDRERVRAETAIATRQRAENEGNQNSLDKLLNERIE